jgi:Mor family transcriptional regulator
MSVCTRCKLEREESQYDKYWHSTRQKFFIRRICNPCMREAYKQYKLKVKQKKLIENNPDYKQCKKCMEYKNVDGFYLSATKNPVGMCKICYNIYHRDKVKDKMEMNGGGEHYFSAPDKYTSEAQKSQVFMVMKTLGWYYTIGENGVGVWNKPGLKENGVFINIVPKVKKIKKRPAVTHGRKLNQNVWGNMETIVKLKEEGYTYKAIAEEYNCSEPTIRSVVIKYRNEKRAD